MYLGRIVEEGPAEQVLGAPRHPYTRALVAAMPGAQTKTPPLEGDVPSPIAPPSGCRFHTRCDFAQDICRRDQPRLTGSGHAVACHFAESLPPPAERIAALAGGERLTRLQSFFRGDAPSLFTGERA
jgi:oligopeptide/dipeptide ABC transporter ATP-binding protein